MKYLFSKRVLGVALIIAMVTLTIVNLPGDQKANAKDYKGSKIKNVILLIGDGMGPAYTTAYRYLKDDPSTKKMEPTVFDPYLVGMQSTHPDDSEENITDSAAAATAMSAGIKTYNGAIAVDNDKEPVDTVLEAAKVKGMATGLVATSQINHATPAAFGAHDEDRHDYNQIADDYFDDLINGKHKVDVLLGGGTKYFIRDNRNLVQEFKADGYNYVTTKEELKQNNSDQLLGLFAEVGMPKAIDRQKDDPSLKEMTVEAIETLNQDKNGFFLMVEGSQIDWAGHANDVVGTMSEMEEFAKAFKAAIEFAKKDGHTLVVATADHATGGMSIGRGGPYVWNPEPIKRADRTPQFMANQINNGTSVEAVLDKYIDFELTEGEIESVKNATEKEVHFAISEIFNKRSNTGWTTSGHTGVDVQIYAYGPGSELFGGRLENTETGELLFDIIK